MTVSVRAATAADETDCIALIETLVGRTASDGWRRVYRQLLEGTRGAVLVGEEAGTLLGVATVSYNLAIRYSGEYSQLEELIVAASARGKNVGGLLVAAAVDASRLRGCAEMGLYLLERTEHNRAFYAKYGFVAVGSEMRQSLHRESR